MFYIINKKSDTAMDLSDGDRTSVIGWGRHGGDNQKWKFIHEGSGYAIENIGFGKYLNIAGEPGNDVRLIGNDSKRLWDIRPD